MKRTNNKKTSKSEQIAITIRSTATVGTLNNATVALQVALTPTAAGLGTVCASLANYIAMYELCKINHMTYRAIPRPVASALLPPWLLGFVPYGGVNPTSATSFENLKTSLLTPGYQMGAANTNAFQTRDNVATLELNEGDFTILEGAGPNGSFIPTNSLGTQTNFGAVWGATLGTAAAVNQQFDIQFELTMTFRDLYDPTALFTRLREEVRLHDQGLLVTRTKEDPSDPNQTESQTARSEQLAQLQSLLERMKTATLT